MRPGTDEFGGDDNGYPGKPSQDEHRNLILLWSAGIGIAYAFLVFFLCWMGYRLFLLYGAYRAGDFDLIRTELTGWGVIAGAYFGTAFILRRLKIL